MLGRLSLVVVALSLPVEVTVVVVDSLPLSSPEVAASRGKVLLVWDTVDAEGVTQRGHCIKF